MLEPGDIGHRVVVRRRIAPEYEGGPSMTDLLGDLIAADIDHLTVRRDDGSEHTVARTDIVAAKRVPPRPVRYSAIDALERSADRAWPAPVHERLGEWFLRAAEGWTNRANSALPLGDPALPLPVAAEACRAWYSGRGLTPKITVPLPLRRDVADTLTQLGWHAQPLVLVQTARLADILASVAQGARVDLLGTPSGDFLRVVSARKASLPESAHHVLTAAPAVRFAEVRQEGALIAQARGALVGETLHIGLVEVAGTARRRGLAQQVTRGLAAWAAAEGGQRAVLQVEEDNDGALRLYERLGFTTHHSYVTYAWRS